MNLTILLPLYDRFEYSEIWLKENYSETLNYYIADGSIKDDNYNFFTKLNLNNISYNRFSPDKNIINYYSKMINALKNIDTKYVMICDNDDFLNLKGIKKIYLYLENNNYLDFASGDTLFVSNDKGEVYRFSDQIYSSKRLENYNKENLITEFISNNYTYVWYSIFKKDTLLNVFNVLNKIKIHDWQFNEVAHSIISLTIGRYKYLNTCHYIRLQNVNTSSTNIYSQRGKKNLFKLLIKDEKLNMELKNLLSYLKEYHNLNISLLEKFFIKLSLKEKNSNDSQLSFFLKIFTKITIIKSFKINTIKKVINLFY